MKKFTNDRRRGILCGPGERLEDLDSADNVSPLTQSTPKTVSTSTDSLVVYSCIYGL